MSAHNFRNPTGVTRLRRTTVRFWHLALPVVLGVVFFVLELLPGSVQDALAVPLAGFMIGLLVTVTIEQLSLRGPVEGNAEDLQQVSRQVAAWSDELKSIEQLARLKPCHRREANDWLAAYVRAMAAVETEHHAFAKAVETRVAHEIGWLQEVSCKRVELGPSVPLRILVSLATTSAQSLNAVAYGEHATSWWATPAGIEYLEANRAAHNNGVQVRRVFVERAFSNASARHKWIEEVERQLNSTFVEVGYIADTTEGDAHEPENFGDDMAIFDRDLLYSSTDLGKGSRLSRDHSEVRRGLDRFEELWFKCNRDPSYISSHLRELSGQVTTVVASEAQSSDFEDLLDDPGFLKEVFVRGMPPAFVKRPGAGPVHILESEALTRFQRAAMGTAQWTEDEITRDHTNADHRVEKDGHDRQLELATPNPTGANYLIMTTKSLIHHDGQRYVVGWYLPAQVAPQSNSLNLRHVNAVLDHIPLLCDPAPPREGGIPLHVGEAVIGKGFVGQPGSTAG